MKSATSKESKKARRVKGPDLCHAIGGDYDFDDETCDIPMDSPKLPVSITRGGMLFYFILQVIVGSLIVVVSVFYSVTLIPTAWWASYIVLGIVFVMGVGILWFKLRKLGEAILREGVALVTVAGLAVVIGWIYHWDITLYWGLVGFASDPIYATIAGLIVSSLLSIILVSPSDLDDSENDFSWNIVL